MNIGTIIQWGSDTLPDGWLLCDGSAISRTDYADLFSVIGTNFGSGNGSTTFNLPDLRGRVGVGKSGDTEFDTLGESGGEKTHTLTTSEMPSHSHNVYQRQGNPAGVSSFYNTNYESGGQDYALKMDAKMVCTGATDFLYTQSVGGGTSHNNLQPYIVTNYIIKALIPDTVKISELDSVINVDGTEVLPIVQSGVTKKVTANKLLELAQETDVYSTSEVQTNKVWIDGKPIYRKVIDCGNLPNNEAKNVAHSISNLGYVIRLYLTVTTGTSFYNSNMAGTSNMYSGGTVLVRATSDNIQIGTNYNYSGHSAYAIIEYTKTTD